MTEIARRGFVKGAGLGALAFTVGGVEMMLTPEQARAQGVPFRMLKGPEVATLEALACGVPVIASAVGGLVETVQHEGTGILVEPGDPRAIVAALGRLADEHIRAGFAASAPASVARHGIERATDEMAAVWASVGVRL